MVKNYDFDILNKYENINMDIQLTLNVLLFIKTIINLKNIPKWCIEKNVKPYKLYCINSNCLALLIVRIIYQSDSIYYHIYNENYNYHLYVTFSVLSALYMNFILNIISIKWAHIFLEMRINSFEKMKFRLIILIARFMNIVLIVSLIPIITIISTITEEISFIRILIIATTIVCTINFVVVSFKMRSCFETIFKVSYASNFISKFFFLILISSIYRSILNIFLIPKASILDNLRINSADENNPHWLNFSYLLIKFIKRAIFSCFYCIFTDFIPILFLLLTYSASSVKKKIDTEQNLIHTNDEISVTPNENDDSEN